MELLSTYIKYVNAKKFYKGKIFKITVILNMDKGLEDLSTYCHRFKKKSHVREVFKTNQ